jgi:uncharacterized membrane protein
MNKSKVMSLVTVLLFWVPMMLLSLLLIHNAMLYFTHGGEYGILPEKVVARQDLVWRVCFYLHLPFGSICLFIPSVLLMRNMIPLKVALHRAIGKLYVYSTLAIVCPTGIYLALYAKGGLVTQVGFVLQGILLYYFTWRGLQAILKGQIQEHRRMMVRSYAVAAVVISFRVLHIIFFLINVRYQDNYALSQWLGLTGNILLAEILLISRNSFTKTSISL